jgi:predicted RNase H-like HicB family nuclease
LAGDERVGILVLEVPMKFKVALYPSEEGVAVCVPSLPGCWSQGETVEEALANIAEAIREYLEAEVEPAEGAELAEVEVAV